jgi:hypothetical protein
MASRLVNRPYGHNAGVGEAVLFAVVASSALPLGALLAVWRPPPRPVTAALLGFASGALITAVAFELFEKAFSTAAPGAPGSPSSPGRPPSSSSTAGSSGARPASGRAVAWSASPCWPA